MGTTLRARYNFLGGVVENNPLASTATTLNSAALNALPSISGAGLEYVPITIDPDGIDGAPEIAWITDHSTSANTATILRGQEGTAARAHYQDIPWVHGPTVLDMGMTDTDRALIRTNFALTGGGAVFCEAAHFWWTTRFIAIAMGAGAHFSTNGYYDLQPPAAGTVIPGSGGAGNVTVTGIGGIPLTAWQSLWAIPTIGGSNSQVTYGITSYTANFVVPSHWIFVASRNGDDGRVRCGNGTTYDYWRPLVYENGWTDYLNSYPTPGYMKDGTDHVHFRGLIKSGTLPSIAFTLPVGYRPHNDRSAPGTYVARHFIGQANNVVGFGGVLFNGGVSLSTQNAWWDISGITPFLAGA